MTPARALLLAVLCNIAPLAAQESAVVYGTVSDTAGQPIPMAWVRVSGTTGQAFTDPNGRYRIGRLPRRTVSVAARAVGYRGDSSTVDLSGGDSARVDFALRASPFTYEPIIVTAAKRSQLLEEAVTSVAEVTSEELDRRAVNEVDEALDRAPGVQLVNDQINIRGSSGYTQGLGSRILLLVDGVPANQGDRGGINWDLLPVDAVERIEIVKGAGSALYGSWAAGGVVNLITRDPAPGLHGRARVTFGMYADPPYDVWRFRDFTGTESGFTGAASYGGDRWRWEMRAGGRHSDGYREHTRADQYHLGGRGVWLSSPTSRLDLAAAYASNQYQTALLWCTLNGCDNRGQDYQPFMVDAGGVGDHTRSDKGLLSVAFRSTPSASLTWRARGSYFHTHFVDFHRSGNDESFADRLGAELQSELHPSPGRVVTMGGEVALSYVSSNIFSGDTADVYRDRSQGEFAAYAESEQRWGTARITIGARLDVIGVDGGAFEAVPSPRIGAVLPTRVGVVRASLGGGFRPPSLAERFVTTTVQGLEVRPNPGIRPEKGWAFEIGNLLAFGQGRWAGFVDVAAFWNEARSLIEPRILQPDSSAPPFIQFVNLDARIRGLDVVAKAGQGGVTFSGAYTYLAATDLTDDRPLAFRPRHLVTLGADLARGPGSVGADYRYMSRMERVEIFETDARVGASVLDLRAGLKRGPMDLRVRVSNALNYIYTLVPRTLAPPRTVSLTLVYTY